MLLKYSGAGAPLWTNVLSGGMHGSAILATDSHGELYMAGMNSDTGFGNDTDFVTLKYSASGAQVWSQLFNGPDNVDDFITSMALDSRGNVYVHGLSVEQT